MNTETILHELRGLNPIWVSIHLDTEDGSAHLNVATKAGKHHAAIGTSVENALKLLLGDLRE